MKKLNKITEWMKELNIPVSIITSTENIFYLTGFTCHPHERLLALAVFQNHNPILLVPKMEELSPRNQGWTGLVVGYLDTENPWSLIQDVIDREVPINPVIAVEKSHLTLLKWENINKNFIGSSIYDIEPFINSLRAIKSEEEIQILREAARFADLAVGFGVESLKVGITEMEVAAQIEGQLKKQGIFMMSFPTMVLFGENTANPHGQTGNNTLKIGDLVQFDLGVVYKGYCSDISRAFIYGCANDSQKEIYEVVRKSQEAAVLISKPGIKMSQVDKTARNIISQAGYGDNFPHRVGHGIGIGVHEFPSIHDKNNEKLEVGMVFTIEPGVYIPSLGGVRIEDDVVITESGIEILTNYPKHLQIISN